MWTVALGPHREESVNLQHKLPGMKCGKAILKEEDRQWQMSKEHRGISDLVTLIQQNISVNWQTHT